MNGIEEKFIKKHTTALGHNRAFVKFTGLKTLWLIQELYVIYLVMDVI